MRWITSQLKSSFMAILGANDSTANHSLKERADDIRTLMLKEIGTYAEQHHPGVVRRVRYAPDIQGLWYLRSDVMAILANMYGETLAAEKMSRISGMFKGFLPGSLSSRPSSLTRY